MINRRAENVTPWGTARGAVKEGNISNSAEYHGEFNTEAIAGYTNSFQRRPCKCRCIYWLEHNGKLVRCNKFVR